MIVVILGSQKFQFNRLLEALDKLVGSGVLGDELLVQAGHSDYRPRHYEAVDFLPKPELDAAIDRAELIISHGGTGAIITALKSGTKVIAVPRNSDFHEHVDNHQHQIVSMFARLDLIEACENPADLGEAIEKARATTYRQFEPNTEVFLAALRQDIDRLGAQARVRKRVKR